MHLYRVLLWLNLPIDGHVVGEQNNLLSVDGKNYTGWPHADTGLTGAELAYIHVLSYSQVRMEPTVYDEDE